MKKLYSLILLVMAMSLSPNKPDAAATELNPDYLFSPKGIATVRINLNGGKQIDDIKRDEKDVKAEKLSANMVIENSNGSTYDDTELYNGLIKIKGRGNTSWNLPKRPLVSLPIQRGEPYKNSFGKSLTSSIGDITAPETAADGAPIIVATAAGVRVVCPSARPGDRLTVTMTDMSGRTVARQTVDSPFGLNHTDIALPSTSAAAIVTATTTSGRSASVKIMR